ncbi:MULTISPECIES: DUF5590 domain-containing protein [Bacillaceae]|uniref:DUF5590 domain-containing protein n=1 Tax=Evansella alkalicola TaxID=745819 RepID=A0ABS6JZ96_9BACI|nr:MULTISPECIES: DUF5590 domain-containing protein [Bacillaceae]MBU9723911.1 DUF5590 domain-containing protein [Bacillus alkalicola]
MKGWIIAIFILFLSIGIGISFKVYQVTSEPLVDRLEEAKELVLNHTELLDVNYVNYFHGRRSFQVFEGKDQDGNEHFVWVEELIEDEDIEPGSIEIDDIPISDTTENEVDVTEDTDESEDMEEQDHVEKEREPQIITRLKNEGLTSSDVRSIIQDRLNINELKSISLGIIGSTPVYEIIYVDNDERHSFYYMTYHDGTYIRHYQFRK